MRDFFGNIISASSTANALKLHGKAVSLKAVPYAFAIACAVTISAPTAMAESDGHSSLKNQLRDGHSTIGTTQNFSKYSGDAGRDFTRSLLKKHNQNKLADSKKIKLRGTQTVLTVTATNAEASDSDLDNGPDDDGFGLEGGAPPLRDPFEPINRFVFGVNDVFDRAIARPIALGYRFVTPRPVRIGIRNAIDNATSPITLVNDLLQGEFERANDTTVRLFVNTLIGAGGFVDVAGMIGIEKHTEDFGQTLAVAGLPSGPYIVAPIIGPSTPRHLIGRVVDTFTTPTTWILFDNSTIESLSPGIADAVTTRETLIETIDSAREGSPDFYATVKDGYYQNRISEINNGNSLDEDFDDDAEGQ